MALIEIDDYYPYSYQPINRYGYGRPPHDLLQKMFAKRLPAYARLVQEFSKYALDIGQISHDPDPENPLQPCWDNGWLPSVDGIALYGLVSAAKPRRYFEVGSGNSTKFVARAKKLNSPQTVIVSIDPAPRAEIDLLCDQVIREPLQNINVDFFNQLMPGDILFIDGSHRMLQNSDVTVFYLDILPHLKPGVIIGQHDILLPWDYSMEWAQRMYSEQYALASVLLAAEDAFEIIFPTFYVSQLEQKLLQPLLNTIWTFPNLQNIVPFGSSFWMTKK